MKTDKYTSLFSQIGPGANLDKIRTLLAEVEENSTEEQQDTVESLRISLDELAKDYDRRGEILRRLYEKTDVFILRSLKSINDIAINNFTSAYDATTFHTKEWFSQTILSEDAKVEFAEYLLKLILAYTKDNTETLKLIATRDPTMMDFIGFPREYE